MAKAKYRSTYVRLRHLLIEVRKKAGLRQLEIAKRLGKPQSYVSKIESGERRLDVGEFVEYAIAIGADPVKLLKQTLAKEL